MLGKTNLEGEVKNQSWSPLCFSLGTYLEGLCCATNLRSRSRTRNCRVPPFVQVILSKRVFVAITFHRLNSCCVVTKSLDVEGHKNFNSKSLIGENMYVPVNSV